MEVLETIQLAASNQNERDALWEIRDALGLGNGAVVAGIDILRITKTEYLTYAQAILIKRGIARDYKPGVIDLRTPAPTSPKTAESDSKGKTTHT